MEEAKLSNYSEVNSPLGPAIIGDQIETAKYLIEKRGEWELLPKHKNREETLKKVPPFFVSVYFDSVKCTNYFFDTKNSNFKSPKKIDLNFVDHSNQNLLHHNALLPTFADPNFPEFHQRSPQITKTLLHSGVLVDHLSLSGRSPLSLAASNGQYLVCSELIDGGFFFFYMFFIDLKKNYLFYIFFLHIKN